MNDIETIRAMLTRAGLEYKEGEWEDKRGVVYATINVEDQGYPGFVSEFWFDKTTGALRHMAGWE